MKNLGKFSLCFGEKSCLFPGSSFHALSYHYKGKNCKGEDQISLLPLVSAIRQSILIIVDVLEPNRGGEEYFSEGRKMETGLIWHQCLPGARPRCQPCVSGDTFMTSSQAHLWCGKVAGLGIVPSAWPFRVRSPQHLWTFYELTWGISRMKGSKV